MTEPPYEQQTVEDIARDLVEFEPTLRGVVVFTIDWTGTGRVAMGGKIQIAEIQTMLACLQTLAVNAGQLNRLMGMTPEGHG